VLAILYAVVAAGSALAGAAAAWVHYRRPVRPGAVRGTAKVSILKPCKGADPELAQNLLSWMRQEDVETETLVGVAREDDPAVAIARQLQARLIVAGEPTRPETNPKVASLTALEREASGDFLLVADSNIRAEPHLAGTLLEAMGDPDVAASYALFFAAPPAHASVPSRLEAAVFSTLVLPSIVGGVRFFQTPNLIGKAMLIRRDVLRELGGWERYERYLVEDGRLGRDLRARGHRIALTDALAEVRLGNMTWRQLWEHEMRWTVLHRVTLPLVPIGMVLWNPWFLAAMTLLTSASGAANAALVLALATLHNFVIKAWPFLRFGGRARELWLLPLLDAMYLVIALLVWVQREVVWRGQSFRLGRGSYIESARALDGPSNCGR
jgi:ceramide glucosyltransferase